MGLFKRLRIIQGSKENFDAVFKAGARKLGIKREHILFGALFLIVATLLIGTYIKIKKLPQYKWVAGGNKPLVVNLSDGDSPLQKMSDEVRDSILETPMAEASAQSQSKSKSGENAARNKPQEATSQSASANSANSPDTVSAAGDSSPSFSPTVSSANSSVMSGQARAENSQSMTMVSSQSRAQSAPMSAVRSNPQDSTTQSASVNSAPSSNKASAAAGESASLSPTVSPASSSVMSGAARAENSQSMTMASSQSRAQSAPMSEARSNPQDSPTQSASANSAPSSNKASAAGGSRESFSPSVSGLRAAASGVMSNGARAEAGRGMSGASSQSLARAASGAKGTARNSPSSSSGQASGSAQAANTSGAVSGSGARGSFSPSVSGLRAAVSGVMSNGARTEAGRGMSGASSQSSLPVARSRLGGGATNTDQVMMQAASQSLAGPVSFDEVRSRPNSAFQPRTVSPVLTMEAAVPEQLNSPTAFVPTASHVHRTVPTLEEVQPTPPFIVAKMSPPVKVNQSRNRPEIVDPKSVRAERKKTDLEIFRAEGFKTRTDGRGKNFVFIIDKSESMLQDNRLDGAKQALTRTLERLGPDENYYIYFFDDKTVGMEEGHLLEATPANISSTGRWVNSLSPRGFTNPRDALTGAFAKLKPSTIWLLSDGKFSSFKHVKIGNKIRLVPLPSVLRMIRKLNVAENVRINTIGFAARPSQVDASLKNIAEENGGAYRFIRTGVE